MIGKCLLQYVLELQKDYKNNKTLVSESFPALLSFLKKMKQGYITSSYVSRFAIFRQKKKSLDLGHYKVKENIRI